MYGLDVPAGIFVRRALRFLPTHSSPEGKLTVMHSHMRIDNQVILRDVRRRSLAALPRGLRAYGLAQGLCVAAMHIALMVLSALACALVHAWNARGVFEVTDDQRHCLYIEVGQNSSEWIGCAM